MDGSSGATAVAPPPRGRYLGRRPQPAAPVRAPRPQPAGTPGTGEHGSVWLRSPAISLSPRGRHWFFTGGKLSAARRAPSARAPHLARQQLASRRGPQAGTATPSRRRPSSPAYREPSRRQGSARQGGHVGRGQQASLRTPRPPATTRTTRTPIRSICFCAELSRPHRVRKFRPEPMFHGHAAERSHLWSRRLPTGTVPSLAPQGNPQVTGSSRSRAQVEGVDRSPGSK